MSGSILLVDDVPTRRIILKVKLSAAYYDVSLATTLDDACASIRVQRPDMVVVSGDMVKEDLVGGVTALRNVLNGADLPIILLADEQDTTLSALGLNAGFDDVIPCPAHEHFLMARLRSLLRLHTQKLDLLKQTRSMGQDPGFAEAPRGFTRPAQVALITQDLRGGTRLRNQLQDCSGHRIQVMGADQLMGTKPDARPKAKMPDLMIADIRGLTRGAGLRLVADLRTFQKMKQCPVVPLLAGDAIDLAANLLDTGVDEVLFEASDPREIAARIQARLDDQRETDQLKDQINDNLQASVTDPLTDLNNRRVGLSYLRKLLKETRDTQRNFAVMVADLDHFKAVNDTYGHPIGDEVLANVASTLRDHLGPEDMIARIGGEEFLIVIPDTSETAAHQVAQTLCDAVGALSLPLPGRKRGLHVTISIGVTFVVPHHCAVSGFDAQVRHLLELADRALYASKAEGRNTVRFSARSAA